MSEISTHDPFAPQGERRDLTPEERRERWLDFLAALDQAREAILARRGGAPFPVEWVEETLAEIRGGNDADLD